MTYLEDLVSSARVNSDSGTSSVMIRVLITVSLEGFGFKQEKQTQRSLLPEG